MYNFFDQIHQILFKLIYITIKILGRHNCLWCEITQAEMKTPKEEREQSPRRTLKSLKSANQLFQNAGSVLSKAKHFMNAIRPPLIDIPIEQVCVVFFNSNM